MASDLFRSAGADMRHMSAAALLSQLRVAIAQKFGRPCFAEVAYIVMASPYLARSPGDQ